MPRSLNLANLLDDERDFQRLIKAREYSGGRVLLDVVEKLRDRERGEIETKPMLTDADITKDVRFRLGFAAALNLVLELPDRAFKYINSLEGRE